MTTNASSGSALTIDTGFVGLYATENAAREAGRLLRAAGGTAVTVHTAVEGWAGEWRGLVRANGDPDELEAAGRDASPFGAYAATFRRIIAHERTWTLGEPTPGIGMLFAITRNPSMSHQEFEDHWYLNHAPLAKRIHLAMWDYVQCGIDRALTPGTAPLDGVAICKCASVEDYRERFFDSEDGRRAIAEDVAIFSDVSASPAMRMVEQVLA